MNLIKPWLIKARIFIFITGLTSLLSVDIIAGEDKQQLKDCYFEQIEKANEAIRAEEIRHYCRTYLSLKNNPTVEGTSALERRLLRERQTRDNPSVITPHMLNYMLPVTFMTNPNAELFKFLNTDDDLDHVEAKFQFSFKTPLFENLIREEDTLYFGFTLQSHWQMYNSDISSPFRETNYKPEIFYAFENNWKLGDWTNRVVMLGFEHQSNGRSQQLSRSWNRIYANFVWDKDNWLLSFKPWYRIPEDKKQDPTEPGGDDNPDIDDYMGYFEFRSIYKWDQQTFSLLLRNNLRSDNKGAVELGWTFPMGRRFKGYAQLFSGYGESLIDYNQQIDRIGVGILLTDFF